MLPFVMEFSLLVINIRKTRLLEPFCVIYGALSKFMLMMNFLFNVYCIKDNNECCGSCEIYILRIYKSPLYFMVLAHLGWDSSSFWKEWIWSWSARLCWLLLATPSVEPWVSFKLISMPINGLVSRTMSFFYGGFRSCSLSIFIKISKHGGMIRLTA